MAGLPTGAQIVPISQPVMLKLDDASTVQAIGMATDGSGMLYLVTSREGAPEWIVENKIASSWLAPPTARSL